MNGTIHNMRVGMTTVLVLSFLAVGVFGISGMTHDMSHGQGCIASALNNNAVCPEDSLASALYHVSAYKSFSEGILGAALFTAGLLLFLLTAALARQSLPLAIPIPISREMRARKRGSGTARSKFIHWLSLLENSPTVVRGA